MSEINDVETRDRAPEEPRPRRRWMFPALVVAIALATAAITALLVNMFTRKQEALTPFVRLVEVNERTTDPEAWGTNWPPSRWPKATRSRPLPRLRPRTFTWKCRR